MIETREAGKPMSPKTQQKPERKDRVRNTWIALGAALVLLGAALAVAYHFRPPAETVRHVLPPLRDRGRTTD